MSVIGIHIVREAGSAPVALEAVRALAGRGLEGDCNFDQRGDEYKGKPSTKELTLIEAEAIEALARDYEIVLEPGASRRNITTRGVALNHLVGREFTVGAVRLRGVRLCEPCGHLEGLTAKGVMKGLAHRGGLRAKILSDGEIRVGDPVRA